MDQETLKEIAAQLRQPNGNQAVQVGEKMNEGNLQINLNAIESLKLEKNDCVLEIGMGNGFFVKELFSKVEDITYTGCDFSEVMVEEARKQNELFILANKVRFYLADANQLPFADNSFDKVFSINTLYFWDKPDVVLSELRRVLKPEGRLTIAIRPKSIMEHYPFVEYGFNMFTKEELAALIKSNQFNVVELIEKDEPDIEINGQVMQTATLLISAESNRVNRMPI